VPDEDPPLVEALHTHDINEPESVIVRENPFGTIARAAVSAPAIALAALITATATMLNMAATSEIAEAKLFSTSGVDNIAVLRWESGTRLIVAVIAFLLAVLAGLRFSHDLPATRYTFSADGEEATESIEGTEAPGWVRFLVGGAFVVAVLAIVLNGVALLMTLGLHMSPNFGAPLG
jgi:hypothetical protein